MQQLELQEAKTRLAELIEEAASGEDVVIRRSDGAFFKIVPIKVDTPYPKYGSAKGLIQMSDDFDEPLEDFDLYEP